MLLRNGFFFIRLLFYFRSIVYSHLIWCDFCVLVNFLWLICGVVHIFCNIALNQSI